MNELPKEITYCSYPPEKKFLEYTREYTDKLFEAANREQMDNLMIDQVVPPSNLKRYLRYFSNINDFCGRSRSEGCLSCGKIYL